MMTIYEVNVDPINEEDLSNAATLTECFESLPAAIRYARSLCHSTIFIADEIKINFSRTFSLKDYNDFERTVRHGK